MASKKKAVLDFVPDEYLKRVQVKLRALEPKQGRSRNLALRFLERDIRKLLRQGYTPEEIMKITNEEHAIASAADIERIIEKIKANKAPPADNEGTTSAPSKKNEMYAKDQTTEEVMDHGDGDVHGDDVSIA